MSYKADLEIQDTINGVMSLGVDYYKGDKGDDGYTPIKGKDYFTQEEIEKIEQDTINKISTDGFVKSADLADVATSGSYKDLKDKPEPIDLTSYPTKNEVEQTYAKKTDIPDTTNLATKIEVQEVENKIPDVSGFVTMTAVESKGYQTETQVNNLINQALGVIENGTY